MAVRAASLTGLLIGAGLGLVAGAQPWWRAVGQSVSVTFTGAQASAGLGQALALVVLVGTLLALVLVVRGRRILGALLVLAGVGALVVGVSRPRPSADAVRSQVREVSLADQFALAPTVWPWVYAAAGLIVIGSALLMLSTAHRWPRRTARFDRAAEESAPAVDLDDPARLWRSQDAGLDPTLDVVPGAAGDAERTRTSSSPAGASVGVDVHEFASGDTMGQQAEVRTGPAGGDGAGQPPRSTPARPVGPGRPLTNDRRNEE